MITVGTALGVTLLVNLPRGTATLLLGIFILAFALYSLVPHRTKLVSVHWAWLAGLAGGVTSTLRRGGPPYAIYLSHRGLTKEQFRATMASPRSPASRWRAAAFLLTGLLLDPEVWWPRSPWCGSAARYQRSAAAVPENLADGCCAPCH